MNVTAVPSINGTTIVQSSREDLHPPGEALAFLFVLVAFQTGLLWLQRRHALVYQYLSLAGTSHIPLTRSIDQSWHNMTKFIYEKCEWIQD